jgi:hypothetical protein
VPRVGGVLVLGRGQAAQPQLGGGGILGGEERVGDVEDDAGLVDGRARQLGQRGPRLVGALGGAQRVGQEQHRGDQVALVVDQVGGLAGQLDRGLGIDAEPDVGGAQERVDVIGIRGDGVLGDGVASVEIALERGQLGVEAHDVGVVAIDARGQARAWRGRPRGRRRRGSGGRRR